MVVEGRTTLTVYPYIYDIDVLIHSENIRTLWKKLMEADERFADVGIKLYYITQVRQCPGLTALSRHRLRLDGMGATRWNISP